MNVIKKKEEFAACVKTDGKILIKDDIIIKIKPRQKMTVDLLFDEEDNVFLDADGNVYILIKDDSDISSSSCCFEVKSLLNGQDENDNNMGEEDGCVGDGEKGDDDDEDGDNSPLPNNNYPYNSYFRFNPDTCQISVYHSPPPRKKRRTVLGI